jgi:hypothetical protein
LSYIGTLGYLSKETQISSEASSKPNLENNPSNIPIIHKKNNMPIANPLLTHSIPVTLNP